MGCKPTHGAGGSAGSMEREQLCLKKGKEATGLGPGQEGECP